MRFRVQWMPAVSIEMGVAESDQRWTTTPDVFSGTVAEAERHQRELQADYGSEVVFRLQPLPLEPEDEPGRWCEGCGGDVTATALDALSCRCRPSVRAAAASGVRPAVKEAVR
jgi:hypothetical protein